MGVEEIKMAPFGIRGERDFVLSGRACGASLRMGHSSSLLKGGQTPWTVRRKKQPAAGKTGDESNLTAKGRVRCVHVCEVRER